MLCCRPEWTAGNLLLYWILWVPVPSIKLNDFYFPQNPVIVFKDLCPPKVSVCQRHWQFNEKYANLTLAWLLVVVVPSGILAKVQGQSLFLKSSWISNTIFFSYIRGLFVEKDSDLVSNPWKPHTYREFIARKFSCCLYQAENVIFHTVW